MNKQLNVLVTGGLGYIGSHTVVELISVGYNVVIIDNLSNSRIEILDQIEKITKVKPIFYKGDLKDLSTINKVFSEQNIHAIIHFAAHLLVDESVEKPLKYYKNNLIGLINLLETAKQNNCNHFLFSSSCTVYGNPKTLPVTEKEEIKKALSPYGSTKIMGEQILEDCVKSSWELAAITLRYFNPVGAHDSGLIGELTNGKPKHLFPIITDCFINNKQLKVYGDDYKTPDGSAVRDYIHVVDLAEAHVKAIDKLLKIDESQYKAYNIGTGKGLSVLEIINTFNETLGSKINYTIQNRRAGDVSEIWADATLAKEELNWVAKKNLTDMVESSFKWAENEKKLYQNG